MFIVFVSDLEEVESKEVSHDDHQLFHEYVGLIPDEIPGMLLQCDFNFYIDLILGA